MILRPSACSITSIFCCFNSWDNSECAYVQSSIMFGIWVHLQHKKCFSPLERCMVPEDSGSRDFPPPPLSPGWSCVAGSQPLPHTCCACCLLCLRWCGWQRAFSSISCCWHTRISSSHYWKPFASLLSGPSFPRFLKYISNHQLQCQSCWVISFPTHSFCRQHFIFSRTPR